MQLFIKFARTLNPILTREAEELLPQLFVQLRERSRGRNGAVSERSYPITVRQLESLIRLSEAVARLHLDDKITTTYVRHAYQLLDESVISLVHSDIILPNDNAEGGDLFEDGQAVAREARENETAQILGQPEAETATRMSYEEYNRIATLVVHYIRQWEAKHEDDEEGDDEGKKKYAVGMRFSDLLSQYLTEHVVPSGVNDMAELEREVALFGKIINRLVTKDNLLIRVVPSEEQQREDQENFERKTKEAEERGEVYTGQVESYLLVHPNLREEF
eukprot:comp23155_c1_seq1/m.37443 comp23155_c1_seq1/g.37443  ORF comp23155_c1_seq1/g.37443 comp23155_c1_seq1/m.37443 type:complete len:276 (-) comp23155_c1_seq1:43-870(-)